MALILASKSPRRRDILTDLGYTFAVRTAPTDETLPDGVHPREGVRLLAVRKGEAVAPLCGEDDVILSSDTLVELDGVALGKPVDQEDARRMLHALSGRAHNVHTGVAVRACMPTQPQRVWCSVRFVRPRSRPTFRRASRWTRQAHTASKVQPARSFRTLRAIWIPSSVFPPV